MDDNQDFVLQEKHRSERKQLQSEIQKLKHSVPKGDKKKKKEVTAQIALLEADLDQKQEEELQQQKETFEISEGVNDLNIEDSTEQKPSKKSKAQKRREKKEQNTREREEQIRAGAVENLQGLRHLELRALTEKLKTRDLAIFEVPSDGDCLYAAILSQLQRQKISSSIAELRKQAADYIRLHSDDFMPFLCNAESGDPFSEEEFQEYCVKLESTIEWGGHLEIQALSSAFQVPIEVIQADSPSVHSGEQYTDRDTILLSYHRHAYKLGEHYNAVIPRKEIKEASDEEEIT